MSPPVAQMVLSAMKIVMGEDGTNEGILFSTLCHYDFFCNVFDERATATIAVQCMLQKVDQIKYFTTLP